MIYRIKQYFKFLFRSTNQHGVHSPFVYNLVTKCFYDKKKYQEYTKIENYRKELLKNKSTIANTEIEAESSITKQQTQVISHIAKTISASKSRTKLLFRLVNYLECNSILELGTSLGVRSQAMSLGNPQGQITAIGGCPNISAFLNASFKQQHLDNIEVINGNIPKITEGLKSNTYDFVFFDDNHNKVETLKSFEALLPTTHNDTVFIFDAIHTSKSKTEAWEVIKQHPKVSVSIDTYHWGFVFFRTEQQKEHFTIRL